MTRTAGIASRIRDNLWAFGVAVLAYGIAAVAVMVAIPAGAPRAYAYWFGLVMLVAGTIVLYASSSDQASDAEGDG